MPLEQTQPIDNLNNLPPAQALMQAITAFIRAREGLGEIGAEGAVYYDDGGNVPTLGFGYALITFNRNRVAGSQYTVRSPAELQAAAAAAGFAFTEADFARLDSIALALNQANFVLAQSLTEGPGGSQIGALFSFDPITEAQGQLLLEHLVSGFLARVRTALGSEADALDGTKELVALVDFAYNVGSIPREIVDAIANGNRASVWFQIRYRWNGGDDPGLQVRRNHESNLFGLFDSANGTFDGISTTNNEARVDAALASLGTLFNARTLPLIADAEQTVGNGIDYYTDLMAQTRAAREFLVQHFVVGSLPSDLTPDFSTDAQLDDLVQRVLSADVVSTTSTIGLIQDDTGTVHSLVNDLVVADEAGSELAGGAGNDILIGLEGGDALYGNEGSDFLFAGCPVRTSALMFVRV